MLSSADQPYVDREPEAGPDAICGQDREPPIDGKRQAGTIGEREAGAACSRPERSHLRGVGVIECDPLDCIGLEVVQHGRDGMTRAYEARQYFRKVHGRHRRAVGGDRDPIVARLFKQQCEKRRRVENEQGRRVYSKASLAASRRRSAINSSTTPCGLRPP